jgi:putative peptide zinc metalloprotease protein
VTPTTKASPATADASATSGSQPNAQAARQKIALPERPQLAPGTRLADQMRESAFKNPPWLVEREGAGYVQVTELLYRIAEQCDGHKTYDEIADAVSEQTGRSVSADNIKVLVGTQLLPKGLVAATDGRVVGGTGGARSLLALSLRSKVIGPELLDGPATVLQWLFWPPVLIGLIALALGSLAWLLLVHGLAEGGRQALYTPGLLLIALAITALAAGFHELGHAAALRYGGGRPKGMGVGLYLVYPAFYTDVSDNYRLPRWGRVRTDLGGVFFHLVFVLGIMGIYLVTRWEMVLVAVPLLLLDAFRQLMPFIRLDGYWTLADITGVPDFLSYVGAFVRRFVPGQEDGASKLPELKWWGSLAFGAYILAVIPILGFSIFTMVRTAPTILATGWDSASKQVGVLGEASHSGNALAMATAAVQLLILALPTAGLIYSLCRFGKRIGLAIWNWSSPTPTRRLIGGLGTLVVLCLVGYLWAPQLPGIGKPGPLYQPTRSSFAPIPENARGTLFDAVGAPQPAWTTRDPAADLPAAAPSPSPVVPGLGTEPAASPETGAAAAATAEASATAAASATAEASATASASGTPGTAATPATTPPASTPAPSSAPTASNSVPRAFSGIGANEDRVGW